jgi:tetratricopeptide (TPR) repeat protein
MPRSTALTNSSRVLGLLLSAALLSLAVPGAATAQRPRERTQRPREQTQRTANTVEGQFTVEVRRASEAAAAKRFDEAEKALTAALLLKPRDAMAHYLLGETHRALGKTNDAVLDLRAALEILSETKDAPLEARALASLATTYERVGELQQARETWIRASQFADDHNDTALTTLTPRSRVQAIDLVFEREHVYIGVRQRAADRERLTGAK